MAIDKQWPSLLDFLGLINKPLHSTSTFSPRFQMFLLLCPAIKDTTVCDNIIYDSIDNNIYVQIRLFCTITGYTPSWFQLYGCLSSYIYCLLVTVSVLNVHRFYATVLKCSAVSSIASKNINVCTSPFLQTSQIRTTASFKSAWSPLISCLVYRKAFMPWLSASFTAHVLTYLSF